MKQQALPDLPTTVRVGHRDFEIVGIGPSESQGSGCRGQIIYVTSIIEVLNRETTPICMLEVLLHEITHAIFRVYGIRERDQDDEEQICSVSAVAWAQIYRDNPDIIRFIDECHIATNPVRGVLANQE